MPTSFTTNPIAGVDLVNAVDGPLNSAGTPVPPFLPNTHITGTNDSLWVYVEANGAVTTGDLVSITTAGTATRCLTSGGSNALFSDIAFSQGVFTSGQFGWVAKKGSNMYVAVSSTAALSAVLYVATTSGKLSTTTAAGTMMGVSLLTAVATATTTVTNANLTWPKWANVGN
jgi:hypothetical protein